MSRVGVEELFDYEADQVARAQVKLPVVNDMQ
jgi:hypothetical protein